MRFYFTISAAPRSASYKIKFLWGTYGTPVPAYIPHIQYKKHSKPSTW